MPRGGSAPGSSSSHGGKSPTEPRPHHRRRLRPRVVMAADLAARHVTSHHTGHRPNSLSSTCFIHLSCVILLVRRGGGREVRCCPRPGVGGGGGSGRGLVASGGLLLWSPGTSHCHTTTRPHQPGDVALICFCFFPVFAVCCQSYSVLDGRGLSWSVFQLHILTWQLALIILL